MERYNFKTVENKWQKFWEQEKTFSTKLDKSKKKFLKKLQFIIMKQKQKQKNSISNLI